ncbi:MAG TPA: DUF3006 domain-containing protein [Anaerolineae bacterium]
MAEELRGVIDRLEGDMAAIVLDDDQRLDLPVSEMPGGMKSGDAVVVRIGASGTWRGAWSKSGKIKLDNGQSIKWPGERAQGEVWLSIEIDAEDTAVRRQRVKSLLDDIFHKPE